jgi:hypothetical protein
MRRNRSSRAGSRMRKPSGVAPGRLFSWVTTAPVADSNRATRRPPTEAALLILLRVKRGLLGLHPLYQFLDPIKDWLIRDAGRHAPVMFDLLIEFDALFTH